jgi:preprotein translocase subunit YajC
MKVELNTLVHLATQTTGAENAGGMMQMLIIPLMLGGMWFLMIAPQRKKQKAHEKMLSELKGGESVMTTSGIYGTINQVKADRFVLKISDNAKIEISKNAVQTVLAKDTN